MKRITLALLCAATLAACASMPSWVPIVGEVTALEICSHVHIGASDQGKVLLGLQSAQAALGRGDFAAAEDELKRLPLTDADRRAIAKLLDAAADSIESGWLNAEFPAQAAALIGECIEGVKSQANAEGANLTTLFPKSIYGPHESRLADDGGGLHDALRWLVSALDAAPTMASEARAIDPPAMVFEIRDPAQGGKVIDPHYRVRGKGYVCAGRWEDASRATLPQPVLNRHAEVRLRAPFIGDEPGCHYSSYPQATPLLPCKFAVTKRFPDVENNVLFACVFNSADGYTVNMQLDYPTAYAATLPVNQATYGEWPFRLPAIAAQPAPTSPPTPIYVSPGITPAATPTAAALPASCTRCTEIGCRLVKACSVD